MRTERTFQPGANASSARKPGGLPLTPAQAGMAFEGLERGPRTNLEQIVLRWDSAPDEAALRAAWTRALQRHSALRTVFDLTDSARPCQHVLPMADLPFAALDLAGAADVALQDFLAKDRDTGVALSPAPPFRLRLLRLSHGAALVWTFSHLLLDGRSFTEILAEVLAGQAPDGDPDASGFYAGLAPPDTPALAGFAQMLAGVERLPSLDLGGLRQAGPMAQLAASLDPAMTGALDRLARDCGATLDTALAAAWGLVLARASGAADAVFGVTRSGRGGGERAGLTGCLIATHPLRVQTVPGQTLGALLTGLRVRQLSLRPAEHAAPQALRALAGPDLGQGLFNTLLIYERQTLNDAVAARLAILAPGMVPPEVTLHEEGALPVTLAVYGEAQLAIRMEHDPAVVAPADAERLLAHFTTLLASMAAAQAATPVARLSSLTPTETGRNADLARPEAPLPAGPYRLLAEGFAAVAERQSDVIALRMVGGEQMRFGALAARAARIAGALTARGAGPGDIVALCLPRGADQVAALLAVAQTGAAFLPMDPGYPEAVLRHMAEDSGARLILCDAAPGWADPARVLGMAEVPAETVPAPAMRPPAPQDPAYVIYTSGSTGPPKGVVVPHRALAAHAVAARQAYALTAADRVLHFASLSFDVALEEIVPTLLCGARLVLRDDAMAQSPAAFLDAVGAEAVSVLNLPTGFWLVLLEALERGARLPASVRLVIVGGEALPASALARWRAVAGDLALVNGYGPTEAAITSAFWRVPGDARDVAVGRAFGHATLHLRSPDLAPVPPGAVGELCIGGPSVALGYLNRPDLTAARFVQDPAGQGRLYRSGDLARWGADGQLRLLGRADRQIKLRGFRIEPGAVEAVLEAQPGVTRALVDVLDADTPAARLIAWVDAPEAGLPALAEALKTRLPPQMRPGLVAVADWPMTPGGKTDRARLPRPEAPPKGTTADSDPLTDELAGLFAETLGLQTVPPDASFFDLGGHSLQLLGLVGRIEARFGQSPGVALIHAQPTPRGVAALVRDQATPAPAPPYFILDIQPEGNLAPIYGVHVLGVNGSFFRPLAAAMGPDQPIFGLTIGMVDVNAPTSVEATARLYLDAIQQHRPQGPINLMGVSLGSYIALELGQLLRAAGRDVRLMALLDAEGPDGRRKLAYSTRLARHCARTLREGPGYLRNILGNKLLELRLRIEKRRILRGERSDQLSHPILTLEAFVAANELAVRDYQAQPWPGRLTVIRARDNIFDSDETIADGLGWAGVAAGGLDLIEVPGDHLTILEDPGVKDLAAAIRRAILRSA